MTNPVDSRPLASNPGASGPHRIDAIPLRHPGRWIAATLIIVIVALFLYGAATNPSYSWDYYAKYIFDRRISKAAMVTLELTVLSMILAIIVGVLMAVMRLSPNTVLRGVSWTYLWIFRGTPVYVQLVLWGLFATIYKSIRVGIPFGPTFFTISSADAISVFWLAVIGLGLNEAAYMAEIVRAGIISVNPGQIEAATALGLTWWQTMTKITLPQAMRIIIPPTGNEVISMLKTTSLVTAVPFTMDLYTRARDISAETFTPIPLLLVASTWYLAVTSVLMIGQYFLERHFARGLRRLGGSRG
jgi:polar amino acid transport system permease protein